MNGRGETDEFFGDRNTSDPSYRLSACDDGVWWNWRKSVDKMCDNLNGRGVYWSQGHIPYIPVTQNIGQIFGLTVRYSMGTSWWMYWIFGKENKVVTPSGIRMYNFWCSGEETPWSLVIGCTRVFGDSFLLFFSYGESFTNTLKCSPPLSQIPALFPIQGSPVPTTWHPSSILSMKITDGKWMEFCFSGSGIKRIKVTHTTFFVT